MDIAAHNDPAASLPSPMPPSPPLWLRPAEAAAYFRISPRTLRRWRELGMPTCRVGRCVLIPCRAAEAWLSGQFLTGTAAAARQENARAGAQSAPRRGRPRRVVV